MHPNFRIHEIDLPEDVAAIARAHQSELPARERARVQDCLAQYTLQLEDLEKRIAEVSTNEDQTKRWFSLVELRRERDDVALRADACEGLLAIVRALPMEVLAEIFERAMVPAPTLLKEKVQRRMEEGDDWEEDDEDDDMLDTYVDVEDLWGRRRPPMAFCYVCRYWKTVAYATPSLWTRMRVRGLMDSPIKLTPLVRAAFVEGMGRWLDRTRSFPWELTINAASQKWDSHEENPTPFPEILATHPARIHLTKLTAEAIRFGLGFGDLELPGVKEALITTDPVDWGWGVRRSEEELIQQTVNAGLPRMPNLERAVLTDYLETATISEQIPWSNLTHLFMATGISKWRRLMRLCRGLKKGAFHIIEFVEGDEDPVPDTVEEVVLEYLEELTFIDASPFLDEEPIPDLVCPALRTMEIHRASRPTWDLSAKKMWGNLTRLIFRTAYMYMDALIVILEALPTLEEGFFRVPDDIRELLAFLTYGRERNNFPPLAGSETRRAAGLYRMTCLKSLGLSLDMTTFTDIGGANSSWMLHPTSFPYTMLAEFVASRTQSVARSDFNTTIPLAALENLVLHVDEVDEFNKTEPWLDKGLEQTLRPYARQYGMKLTVLEAGKQAYGAPMSKKKWVWRHWSDGFMKFMEGKEFGRLPKQLPITEDLEEWPEF